MSVRLAAADRTLAGALEAGSGDRPDLVVHCLGPGDRPLHGLAGLVDFASGGALTRLLRAPAEFEGRAGEALLLSLRARALGGPTLLAGIGAGDPETCAARLRAWVGRVAAMGVGRVLVGLPAGPVRGRDRLGLAEAFARAAMAAEDGPAANVAWTLAVEPEDLGRLRSLLQGPLRAATDPPAP